MSEMPHESSCPQKWFSNALFGAQGILRLSICLLMFRKPRGPEQYPSVQGHLDMKLQSQEATPVPSTFPPKSPPSPGTPDFPLPRDHGHLHAYCALHKSCSCLETSFHFSVSPNYIPV